MGYDWSKNMKFSINVIFILWKQPNPYGNMGQPERTEIHHEVTICLNRSFLNYEDLEILYTQDGARKQEFTDELNGICKIFVKLR